MKSRKCTAREAWMLRLQQTILADNENLFMAGRIDWETANFMYAAGHSAEYAAARLVKLARRPTAVVFRKWPEKEGGGVLALFPDIPHDQYGFFCSSYQHAGQHGPATYAGCIRDTLPATPEEYAPLLKELQQLGYSDLKIYKRRPNRKEMRS